MSARALRTARETGKFEAEGWRVRKDGSRFYAHVVVTALHDPSAPSRRPSGRLRGFSQQSEVGEPIELLRAGMLFHARGLVNTKAIQHYLDWVWPYWV